MFRAASETDKIELVVTYILFLTRASMLPVRLPAHYPPVSFFDLECKPKQRHA